MMSQAATMIRVRAREPLRRRGVFAALVVCAVIVALTGAVAASGGETRSRLDGVTDIPPFPDEIKSMGVPYLWDEMDPRVAEWEAAMQIDSLTQTQIVAAMDELTHAVATRSNDTDWLWIREAFERRSVLCRALASDHPYRGGEYCD